MVATIVDLEKEKHINTLLDRIGEAIEGNPTMAERTFEYLEKEPEMGTKDPTAPQRTARWRDKRKAEGRQRLTAWLTPEANQALIILRERSGQTIDIVASEALIKAAMDEDFLLLADS